MVDQVTGVLKGNLISFFSDATIEVTSEINNRLSKRRRKNLEKL